MEKQIIDADKRRLLTKALLISLIPLACATAEARPTHYIRPVLKVVSYPSQERQQRFFTPFGEASNSRIASIAKKDLGTYFKRGVSYQCANYVSHVVERAGGRPPRSKSMARAWLNWGRAVNKSSMRAGDIIVTSRGSNPSSGHILIYKGNGVAIHRSTHCSPIQEIRVSVYKNRILGVRRHS